MQIRRGKEDDLDQIFALYRQLGDPDGPLTMERLRGGWRRMTRQGVFTPFVAVEDERVVGTFLFAVLEALGSRCRPVAVVEDVVVDSMIRGRGIGRAMMTHAMNLAAAANCYKLMLSSNRHREEAHRFYESLGFERHGHSFTIDVRPRS